MRKLLFVGLILVTINCRNQKKKDSVELLNGTLQKTVELSEECVNHISQVGVSSDLVERDISNLKSLHEPNIEKILLVYYVEKGYVIKNYNSKILIFSDKSGHIITHLNNEKSPFQETNFEELNLDKFYSNIRNKVAEEKDEITRNSVVILEIGVDNFDCYSFYNLKSEEVENMRKLIL